MPRPACVGHDLPVNFSESTRRNTISAIDAIAKSREVRTASNTVNCGYASRIGQCSRSNILSPSVLIMDPSSKAEHPFQPPHSCDKDSVATRHALSLRLDL